MTAKVSDFIDRYGYSPDSLLTSEVEVWRRLAAILGDKVMRFNPYSVDDDTLLASVERAVWQPWPALTQMVVFHFTGIRRVEWRHPYEAVFFRIGEDPRETHLPLSALTEGLTYTATRGRLHTTLDGQPLTNAGMAERLCGRDCFVSHALPAERGNGRKAPAYRMYRLAGDKQDRARKIRERMLASKALMLGEILAHPHCADYLQCSRDFVGYAAAINEALASIREFPDFHR